MELHLEAVDIVTPGQWHWLLTDQESGRVLADHHVELDQDDAARFGGLYEHVRWFAAPDRLAEDGARLVRNAGAWAGSVLLGESIVAAIVAAEPVTVRVTVPPPLDPLLQWPLELSHASGKPLAARGDVSFVYDLADDQRVRMTAPTAGSLRMLAVFSQPTQTDALGLRRERYALSRLIRRITARQRCAVELRVVQYGATRQRLAEIVDSADGWDVLHLSGHGTGGMFLLETEDGSPDRVTTAELATLLRPLRRQVKLAVVSACASAADTTAQTLRLLGLTEQAETLEAAPDEVVMQPELPMARELVRELGCAVVGMRYPVHDEFAIAFCEAFYEQLLSRQQPADVAAARAAADAARAEAPSAWPDALSLVTPGVFGARAVGLRVQVPRREHPLFDPSEQKMSYFPAEPDRFVGRAAAMARASTALAPSSGRTGVLLHGMAGAGKTACALELAYRHQDAFAAAAFWQAPVNDDEWTGALASFAARLEIQLGDYGFAMIAHIGTESALDAFLPRFRNTLARAGILLVLDNLETLLTPDGSWRDPRWEKLFSALIGHNGESRVILTSRIAPNGGGRPVEIVPKQVVALPVHALSLGESVVLARELPNLRVLMHADSGPVRASSVVSVADDRERLRRVLRVVQGHPKLMELADAAAADRGWLDQRLAAAEAAAESSGMELDAFFRDGTSTVDPSQFLDALTGWTTGALEAIPVQARRMAEFVACLETSDRQSGIIEANWGDLWRRLGGPGDPPPPGPLLGTLISAALLEAGSPQVVEDRGERDYVWYQMHPGVAAFIGAAARADTRAAVDHELGAFWQAVAYQASVREGGEDSGLVVRAGLAAAGYLLRQQDWDAAGALLENSVLRDGSPTVLQAALPGLRRIADATNAPANLNALARALIWLDPGEAELMLRHALDAASATVDYVAASAVLGDLVVLLMNSGRLTDALAATGQFAEYTRRARLGPWTQLAAEAQRLQVLGKLGEHAAVLAQAEMLREAMDQLPARSTATEAVTPWNVRETILEIALGSARALGEWRRCLDLNGEILASKRSHDASQHEVTSARLNDATPLLRLGNLAEAGRLMSECQSYFEDSADTRMLGYVLSLRADLEGELHHYETACDLASTALRLLYARPEPGMIALGHFNFAAYRLVLGGDPVGGYCHQVAAALIYQLTGMAHDLAHALRETARTLLEQSGTAIPSRLNEITNVVERTDGVRFRALVTALCPDQAQAEDTLASLLRRAADPAVFTTARNERQAFSEQAVLFADLVVAAVRGDTLARSSLDLALPVLRSSQRTAPLARWISQILAGANPAEASWVPGATADEESLALKNYIAARAGRLSRRP